MKRKLQSFNQEKYRTNLEPDIIDLKSMIDKTYSDHFDNIMINQIELDSQFKPESKYYYLEIRIDSKSMGHSYYYDGYIQVDYDSIYENYEINISILSKTQSEFIDLLRKMNEKLIEDSVPYMASVN